MEKQLGYSFLTLKMVDEEKREFTGIASTPESDRVNDVMVPKGAKFRLPMPFLWQHDHMKPVGEIYEAKVTSKGIEVKGRIKAVAAPSQLAARLDEAWVSIKEGLVRGLSIGFKPIKYSFLDDGGTQFDEWDWYELSAVTVPANASGQITSIKQIKSFDAALRASSGLCVNTAENDPKPPAVAEKHKTVKINQKEKEMSLSEKIKNFRDELEDKNKKLVELAEKSAEEGQTFDEADQETFDTLSDEIKTLKEHISRLETAQQASMKTARAVNADDGADETKASSTRGGQTQSFARVKTKENLEKGIGFARLMRCKGLAKMTGESATEIARQNYGEDSSVYGILKTAVAAGTSAHSTWAGPLVGDESTVYADFVEYLRPMTIIGKFGQNGVPGLTRIPFRTRLISQTSGTTGYWVGEGKPKPVTKLDLAGTTLEPLKVANIAVVTMELLRDSSPSAELVLRNDMAAALTARLDADFLNPTLDAVSGKSPASISFGVTPTAATGTDADAVRADLANLLINFANANNPPASGVIVMSATVAIRLMAMRNALGVREFPDITMMGGTLEGFPVIVSQYISAFADSAGEFIFMINASDIYLGDEGGISIDMTDQASLQMDNDPTDPVTASTVLVSLWQHNLVGFRAERTINWAKRRSTAVAVIDGVNYAV